MLQILKKYVYGYNKEEAVEEASRCLNCKNAKCMKGCPVSINIPAFIAQVKEGNFEEAYKLSVSPVHFRLSVVVYVRRRASVKVNVSAVSKGEAVSIGKLERFVADWAKENGIKPKFRQRKTDIKLQLSVPVLQVLPAQETWQSLATM